MKMYNGGRGAGREAGAEAANVIQMIRAPIRSGFSNPKLTIPAFLHFIEYCFNRNSLGLTG